MIDIYLLNKKINDLEHQIIPQDIYSTTIHRGRIDALYWLKHSNEIIRTDKDIENKILRYKEEMLCLDKGDMWYDEKSARIEELESILGNEK